MQPIDNLKNWHSGQGEWRDTPVDKWNNWAWQLQNRINTTEKLEALMELTPEEKAGCLFANKKLALSITPHFFNLIDKENPNCPIRLQVIPREAEMNTSSDEVLDPVGEEPNTPVEGLVHKYPDRVLFLVTDRCAAYCRYCTRSRLVSNAQDYNFHPEFEKGLQYIQEHQEVRDVIISGGDPLLLSDKKIDYLLEQLKAIPHIEVVRINSRIPIFLPQRITPELCDVLKKHGPVWMSIHVNHPKECTQELYQACERLAFAGVPLGNQSVLLKGINDDISTMKSLVHRLLMMRVKPYYLYQCDLITGSSHFRTNIQSGIDLIRGLRGHTSGYAIPHYVIDAPGGGGKIPISPDYIEKTKGNQLILKNYAGIIAQYPKAVFN